MRNKVFKKLLSMVLTGALTMGLCSGVVMADETGGTLTASLSLNESYLNGENMSGSLKLTNNHNRSVKNISLSFSVPEGYEAQYSSMPDTIPAGGSANVNVTVIDKDTTDILMVKQKKDIKDKFSDFNNIKSYKIEPKKAASVKKGILTAKKPGDITVTAISKDGKELGTYKAVIEQSKIKKITADSTTFNLLDKMELKKAWPNKWTNANTDIVSLDEKTGDVTLLKKGKATVIAEFGDGKNAAKCKIKITAPKSLFSGSDAGASTKSVDDAVVETKEAKTEEVKAPVKGGKAKVYSENTLSTAAERPVIVDGRRKSVKVTVHYELLAGTALDIINDMIGGNSDVAYDSTGNVNFLDGDFTDKKVTDAASAADVFNEIGILFENSVNEVDGIGGVKADPEDITVYEDKESGKTLYRYEPSVLSSSYDSEKDEYVEEKIPVIGSQVIISADSETGKVDGLYNSFAKGVKLTYSPYFDEYDEEYAKSAIARELLKEKDISDLIEGEYDSDKENTLKAFLTLGANPEKACYINNNSTTGVYKVIVSGTIVSGEKVLEIKRAAYVNGSTVCLMEDLLRHGSIENEGSVILKDGDDDDVDGEGDGDGAGDGDGLDDGSSKVEVPKIEFVDLPKDSGITVSYADGTDKAAREAAAKKLLDVIKTTKNRYKDTLQGGIFDKDVKVKCLFGAPSLSAAWDASDTDNISLVFNLRNASDTNETELNSLAGHEFSHAMVGRYLKDDESFFVNVGETKIVSEAYADIVTDLVNGELVKSSTEMKYSDINFKAEDTSSYKQVLKYAAYKMMSDDRTKDVSAELWNKIFLGSISRLPEDANLLNVRYAVVCVAKELGGFQDPGQQAVKEAFDAAGIKAPDTVRIILTWGEEPSDLDSHLIGPNPDGVGQFHVWYPDREVYMDNGLYAADLDYDDISSYGPEVTTIYTMTPGDYYFIVNNYSVGSDSDVPEDTKMAASGATIRLYYGDSDHKQQKEYKIDPSTKGTYWTVFKLTIDENGEVSSVTDINYYSVIEELKGIMNYNVYEDYSYDDYDDEGEDEYEGD